MITKPRQKGEDVKRLSSILVALGLTALIFAVPAAADRPDPPEHVAVTLCHATHSETNPYVEITVDDDSVQFQAHAEHQDNEDIIPAFTFTSGDTYPGQNLQLLSILENGCNVPVVTIPTIPEDTTTTTEVISSTTTTLVETTTTTSTTSFTSLPETTVVTMSSEPSSPTTIAAPAGTTSELPRTGFNELLAGIGSLLTLSGAFLKRKFS